LGDEKERGGRKGGKKYYSRKTIIEENGEHTEYARPFIGYSKSGFPKRGQEGGRRRDTEKKGLN